MVGLGIMVDWSTCPPQDGPARDAWMLDAIREGDYEVELHEITLELEDQVGTFYVFADALKVGGVRINVSAYLQQQIADLLQASLLTPRLADLIYTSRSLTLDPMPRTITSTTAAMIDQSKKIDAKIQEKIPPEQGFLPPGSIVNTVGKHWVLVNNLFSPQAKAAKKGANYGWHFEGASFDGMKGEPSVSLPGVRVIQGVGTAHNDRHTDYSQICQLVMRECWVDGEPWDVGDVMRDPHRCRLVMPAGGAPLQEDRQPGVPRLDPLDIGLTLGPNPHKSTPSGSRTGRWVLGGALLGVVVAGAWALSRLANLAEPVAEGREDSRPRDDLAPGEAGLLAVALLARGAVAAALAAVDVIPEQGRLGHQAGVWERTLVRAPVAGPVVGPCVVNPPVQGSTLAVLEIRL